LHPRSRGARDRSHGKGVVVERPHGPHANESIAEKISLAPLRCTWVKIADIARLSIRLPGMQERRAHEARRAWRQ